MKMLDIYDILCILPLIIFPAVYLQEHFLLMNVYFSVILLIVTVFDTRPGDNRSVYSIMPLICEWMMFWIKKLTELSLMFK